MNQNINNFASLAGRLLLAAIFILSGYNKIGGFEGTLGYMASKGLPFASILLVLTIIVELGGGLLLALGFQTRKAALLIFLFLIPVTFIFHNPSAADQMTNFLKNLAIMGGMLMVVANGAGALSVDGRRTV